MKGTVNNFGAVQFFSGIITVLILTALSSGHLLSLYSKLF